MSLSPEDAPTERSTAPDAVPRGPRRGRYPPRAVDPGDGHAPVKVPAPALAAKQIARRRRVIEAALALAAKGGYEAVQMRDVAARANVALGTVYRYFASKDHLLAETLLEWTGELRARVIRNPPKGRTVAERLIDVMNRLCDAVESELDLSAAFIRALQSPEPAVTEAFLQVGDQLEAMCDEVLGDLDPDVRDEVFMVIEHVWHSTMQGWANGRHPLSYTRDQLEMVIRLIFERAPVIAVAVGGRRSAATR